MTVGQDLRGKENLTDEVRSGDEHASRLEEARREPRPGQDAAEEEEAVRLHGRRACDRKDDGEDENVDEEEEERVDEAPEEPEHVASVAGLELPTDEAPDEDTVAEEGGDEFDHGSGGGRGAASRDPQEWERLCDAEPLASRRTTARMYSAWASLNPSSSLREAMRCSGPLAGALGPGRRRWSSARSAVRTMTLTRSASTSQSPQKQAILWISVPCR